ERIQTRSWPRNANAVAMVSRSHLDAATDSMVANDGEAPLLLHNSGHNGNHFINFKLVGTKSNRDAIGARIRVLAGGLSQIREVQSGGSYLSQSDLRANFGLGKESMVTTVEVNWPSGLHQTFHNVKADTFYRITESQDELGLQRFLPGLKPPESTRRDSTPIH
ncbi:MAG TPA: ASPIC/UnbV domain-containing protein, partial [Candidatus Dormibacteraeota bacterium]|nr:ASPIC/UnbV domain-containing protein [Candidatus Dormibacteraeota bacterium]